MIYGSKTDISVIYRSSLISYRILLISNISNIFIPDMWYMRFDEFTDDRVVTGLITSIGVSVTKRMELETEVKVGFDPTKTS